MSPPSLLRAPLNDLIDVPVSVPQLQRGGKGPSLPLGPESLPEESHLLGGNVGVGTGPWGLWLAQLLQERGEAETKACADGASECPPTPSSCDVTKPSKSSSHAQLCDLSMAFDLLTQEGVWR